MSMSMSTSTSTSMSTSTSTSMSKLCCPPHQRWEASTGGPGGSCRAPAQTVQVSSLVSFCISENVTPSSQNLAPPFSAQGDHTLQTLNLKPIVHEQPGPEMRRNLKWEDGLKLGRIVEGRHRLAATTGGHFVCVLADGRPCVLFQARKLSLRYERQKQLDLTERAFSPQKDVDISESVCSQDKATLLMRFGDVEGLGGLSIRLQLSNTFHESPGQWWFSVESVSVLYNASEEAVFSASEVYAPSSSSYHCSHVSSLQRHRALLVPRGDHARRWAVTFTNFQIQAFNISSGTFSPASDCAAFLTPAVLMGLITSLILLLVLAYGLHMLVHLKNIDGDNEHKADVYFPANAEQLEQGWDEK
ncbi:hypothetical protein fugu_005477 [Takifugu bimaculatus]|uniref:ATPase H+ transporting accessory protein 1 like n=1 Tax=Takifugu bimaculatus TaxID=433685 RepID=A0A4Z2BAJ8_9TELE|nr:hypothetical protein fugu_005477 [Takifugu bimaculatus]